MLLKHGNLDSNVQHPHKISYWSGEVRDGGEGMGRQRRCCPGSRFSEKLQLKGAGRAQ